MEGWVFGVMQEVSLKPQGDKIHVTEKNKVRVKNSYVKCKIPFLDYAFSCQKVVTKKMVSISQIV